MEDIPPDSYGPLLETTPRIVTWNVCGRYGPWREREAAIAAALRALLGSAGSPVTGTRT
jgi:hypothetical protein